jgi:hypothetical protein
MSSPDRIEAASAAEQEYLEQRKREARVEQEKFEERDFRRQVADELTRRGNHHLFRHLRSVLHPDHDITGEDYSVTIDLHDEPRLIISMHFDRNEQPKLTEESFEDFSSVRTPIFITTYGKLPPEIRDLLARGRRQWPDLYPNDGRLTGELESSLTVPGVPGLDEFLGRLKIHIDKEPILAASRNLRTRKAIMERLRPWFVFAAGLAIVALPSLLF